MDRSVLIDWLGFTTRRTLAEIVVLFASLPFPLELQEKGLNGYTMTMKSESGVTVAFSHGRSDIHVEISGTGCKNFSWFKLMDLIGPDDSCTRLDIALDCMNSGFTCADIWGFLQRGEFVAVSRDIRKIEGLLLGSGYTIYVGSSKSERMVRIYDKGAEQKIGGDWMRYEIQLRKHSANRVASLIRRGGDFPSLAMGLLNKQIRLVDPTQYDKRHDKSMRYCESIMKWQEITDYNESFSLQLPVRGKCAANLIRYVKNAGAALRCLRGAMDDYSVFIHDVVDSAVLKAKHLAVQRELRDPAPLVCAFGYMEYCDTEMFA